ncbi:hypothetical protein AMAG_14234 [Allomyces macrogynus ATCC 38327]|uniref:Uncharacterized protein n=1 Tax=Allomyces macrogynus (strain ATCC 38327) TaxID=578462 RepID=A0A0L0T4D6_ALLM3|nr:hypothetical protein AMAG_14234 [Allomyces macrogynus ATCC 38327]|eukprot:KNE69678.1 hypothetical protein AMAG_14234 [Allomyces macrogynus ATCC 38327]
MVVVRPAHLGRLRHAPSGRDRAQIFARGQRSSSRSTAHNVQEINGVRHYDLARQARQHGAGRRRAQGHVVGVDQALVEHTKDLSSVMANYLTDQDVSAGAPQELLAQVWPYAALVHEAATVASVIASSYLDVSANTVLGAPLVKLVREVIDHGEKDDGAVCAVQGKMMDDAAEGAKQAMALAAATNRKLFKDLQATWQNLFQTSKARKASWKSDLAMLVFGAVLMDMYRNFSTPHRTEYITSIVVDLGGRAT